MSKDIPLPKDNNSPAKDFDIQEVKPSSQSPNIRVEEGGIVDLGKQLDPLERLERWDKMSEQREKRKMCKRIAYLILVLTTAWIILGLVDYLRTGHTFLLASSSMMNVPVLIIMGYYFGTQLVQQLLQRYLHRGP